MRHILSLLLISALGLAAAACRENLGGSPRVVVIGDQLKLRDPASGPLSASQAVLLENVAQGLVRFDSSGNIVGGLAERWNVSDDGMSYIFRLAATQWPDGRKLTAEQVARILKRSLAARSRNPLKETLGVVDDIVAMTERVIEIRLSAPRPNLLSILAQPEFGIVRDGRGTGPFVAAADPRVPGALQLTRQILSGDEESTEREEVLLSAAPVEQAVRAFAAEESDLVLGGTFIDLPHARRIKLPRGSLRFDPAAGLFGLVPVRARDEPEDAEKRRLLSQAIDRDAIVSALAIPGLAPRATVLEPGLDGIPPPPVPAWLATPLAERVAGLRADADRLFDEAAEKTIRVSLPEGPGAEMLLGQLARSWGALGLTVERAASRAEADFVLVDEVAPSLSPAWFVRHFHCGTAAVCDPDTDALLDAARESLVPQQRYALLQQAAARIDDAQLFLPITAPVRWSLVGPRIQGFAGNRFAVHTLTDLAQKPGSGG